MNKSVLPTIALSLLCVFCTNTSQKEVSYPAYAQVHLGRSFVSGAWQVDIARAELGFGPVYMCSAASGSATLCNTALQELTTVRTLDALDAQRQFLGTVVGFSGAVKSASYDMGVHWFDTQVSATASPEAPEGHSLVVEGTARKALLGAIPFVMHVDAQPAFQGQRAFPSAPAVADIDSGGQTLVVNLEVQAWLAQIDWDEASKRPERPLQIGVKSPEHNAVLVGMKAAAPAQFRFEQGPP